MIAIKNSSEKVWVFTSAMSCMNLELPPRRWTALVHRFHCSRASCGDSSAAFPVASVTPLGQLPADGSPVCVWLTNTYGLAAFQWNAGRGKALITRRKRGGRQVLWVGMKPTTYDDGQPPPSVGGEPSDVQAFTYSNRCWNELAGLLYIISFCSQCAWIQFLLQTSFSNPVSLIRWVFRLFFLSSVG